MGERHRCGSNFMLTTTIAQDNDVCPNQCNFLQEKGECDPSGTGRCLCYDGWSGPDCSCTIADDEAGLCPELAPFRGKDVACPEKDSEEKDPDLVSSSPTRTIRINMVISFFVFAMI